MREFFLPLLPFGRVDNVLFRAGVGFAPHALGIDDARAQLKKFSSDGFTTLVLGSHFFEWTGRSKLLKEAAALKLMTWIQIAPGAELSEFKGWIASHSDQDFGLEIVLDRPLYSKDSAALSELKAMGVRIRYLFCPTREIDTARALSQLSTEVLENLRFYFPPKAAASDSFLGLDEIFLVARSLRERFPMLPLKTARYFEAVEPAAAAQERQFRFSLDEAAYRDGFVRIGGLGAVRKAIALLVSFQILRLPVILLYYLVWFARSPLEMLQDSLIRIRGVLGRARVRLIQAYWKTRHVYLKLGTLFYWSLVKAKGQVLIVATGKWIWQIRHVALWSVNRLFWTAVRLLGSAKVGAVKCVWQIRHVALWSVNRLFWTAVSLSGITKVAVIRVYWFCYSRFFALYWFLHPLFTSPAWFFKKRLPPLYWLLIFPFQKAFWFTEHQIRKRVFRHA